MTKHDFLLRINFIKTFINKLYVNSLINLIFKKFYVWVSLKLSFIKIFLLITFLIYYKQTLN